MIDLVAASTCPINKYRLVFFCVTKYVIPVPDYSSAVAGTHCAYP